MRAARLMNVAPWELLDKPICWMSWALAMEKAEGEAVEAARGKKVG